MSTVTCPNGHPSVATDYCDTCGAPIAPDVGAAPAGSPPTPAPAPSSGGAIMPATQACPNCGTHNVSDALFCEACGYDFTTGAMPRPTPPTSSLDLGATGAPQPPLAPPAPTAPAPTTATAQPPLAPPVPLEWVVEAWVDPDWYALQDSDQPCPSPGLPRIIPLTVRSVLIGRTSRSRNIHPEIDCSPDIGVSRRHAQLSTDGTRWWIEDLQSSNGTFRGPDTGPPPSEPLTPGMRHELHEGDRVYVGAWTRLVVRRATEEEKASHR